MKHECRNLTLISASVSLERNADRLAQVTEHRFGALRERTDRPSETIAKPGMMSLQSRFCPEVKGKQVTQPHDGILDFLKPLQVQDRKPW